MRPNGSAHDLEMRRRHAVQLMEEQGFSAAEVAEMVGANERTVRRWRQQAREGGEQGLAAKPHPGPATKLNDQQQAELVQIMLRGAQAAGFMTDTWTCARVAEVVSVSLASPTTWAISAASCAVCISRRSGRSAWPRSAIPRRPRGGVATSGGG